MCQQSVYGALIFFRCLCRLNSLESRANLISLVVHAPRDASSAPGVSGKSRWFWLQEIRSNWWAEAGPVRKKSVGRGDCVRVTGEKGAGKALGLIPANEYAQRRGTEWASITSFHSSSSRWVFCKSSFHIRSTISPHRAAHRFMVDRTDKIALNPFRSLRTPVFGTEAHPPKQGMHSLITDLRAQASWPGATSRSEWDADERFYSPTASKLDPCRAKNANGWKQQQNADARFLRKRTAADRDQDQFEGLASLSGAFDEAWEVLLGSPIGLDRHIKEHGCDRAEEVTSSLLPMALPSFPFSREESPTRAGSTLKSAAIKSAS
jgi:hypothetical protein